MGRAVSTFWLMGGVGSTFWLMGGAPSTFWLMGGVGSGPVGTLPAFRSLCLFSFLVFSFPVVCLRTPSSKGGGSLGVLEGGRYLGVVEGGRLLGVLEGGGVLSAGVCLELFTFFLRGISASPDGVEPLP